MRGRRRRTRCIGFDPGFLCFKPCGRPGTGLATVELRPDELEALRLADLEGLYQEACAARMGVSRTTLSRTLAQARRKVAEALIQGKRLVVAPGRDGLETTDLADEPRSPAEDQGEQERRCRAGHDGPIPDAAPAPALPRVGRQADENSEHSQSGEE